MLGLEERNANFINLFKEFHIKHSKAVDVMYPDYRELLSPTAYEEKYNLAYLWVKKSILKKYSGKQCSTKEKSFIIHSKKLFIFSPYNLDKEGIHLDLSMYLDIIENSDNYFEYIKKLKRTPLLTLFKLDDLHSFCADIMIVGIMNVKINKPKFGNLYFDREEEKDFDEIEKDWWEKNYNRVFYDCRALLVKHVSKYLEREIRDTGNDIEKFLQKIISEQDFPKLLEDSLNEIINQFRIMRNMLGKEEGETKKNKEWLRSFGMSGEKRKKLSTRITIDLAKAVHNILIILEKEKNN